MRVVQQFQSCMLAAWESKAALWGGLLFIWFVALCVVPDPRPLAAPDAPVRLMQSSIGISESAARVLATLILRAAGLGLLGMLVALTLGAISTGVTRWLGVLIAPILAIIALWLNFHYFPVWQQQLLASVSAIAGALLGISVQRSWLAAGALAALAAGLFAWGTATQIPDDLDRSARLTGLHIMENLDQVPNGDEGFAALMRLAFSYAEDNSHGRDAAFSNRAAILALGVILGEDRVAEVARRQLRSEDRGERIALRRRITLRERNDLSQHFWVSAALTVLSDEQRAITVGITKEMKDSTPGGSGFSFVDMVANKSGIRFAVLATRDAKSALAMQMRASTAVNSFDFIPAIDGLTEGLTQDEFQTQYGGLGGAETRRLFDEIDARVEKCPGFRLVWDR
ncbi:MAG: hypothetical protein NXI32_18245 [bacterium]|nr:hypothetical protein [bacterium]